MQIRRISPQLRCRVTANGPILSILLATLLVFGSGLGASFHLDDYTLFSDPAITSPSGWWQIWRGLQTRPLTYFTFWGNFQLGGQNSAGYHAVNLGLHLIAVALLYRVLGRVTGQKAALIAAALFAFHPIQTEAVMYVFERAILLATIFCLLSLEAWLDGRYWAAAAWFGLGLLAKEECVTFPLFLLLFRRALLPAAGMLCLSLAAGVRVLLAMKFLHVSGAGTAAGISPLEYFATQGTVILRYFRLLFIPYGFTFDPNIAIVRDWRGWWAWVVVLGTAALLWKFVRHGKWFAGGLILLAPSSSIFPAQDLAADRRLYLPMVAFAALAGLLLKDIDTRKVLIPAAVGLATISFFRAQVWRSEQALCTEAIRRAPTKLRPRILLARASPPGAALEILDAAEAIAPADPDPATEKGLRLLEMGLPEMALAEFERALALAPHEPRSLNNRGVALSRLGRREAAIEDFRQALRLDPCWPTPRENLELLGVEYPLPCR